MVFHALWNFLGRPEFIVNGLLTGTRDTNLAATESLYCKVKSHPASSITWFFNNESISSASYTQSLVSAASDMETRESTLAVTNIKREDHGNYTCRATNAVGSSDQSLILNVLCTRD